MTYQLILHDGRVQLAQALAQNECLVCARREQPLRPMQLGQDPEECKTILASIHNLFYFYRMETVTLSSKYQVVIPRSVRNRLKLRPGMKLQVVEYNGRVEFLPVRKPAKLRGILKGLEPDIEREQDRM